MAKRGGSTKQANELLPVYAFVGEETFLQQQALENVVEQLGDAQRSDFDGERAELAEVMDELRSFAMFGGRRLAIVRDADAFITKYRQTLEDYAADPSDTGVLVLRCKTLPKNTRLYKAIDKLGGIVDCSPPSEKELPRWIGRHAKQAYDLTVEEEAAYMLADVIGAHLSRLDTELSKLSLQADDGRVGPEMIRGNVAFGREQQMWAMTDALTVGDAEGALRIWRQLRQTDNSAEFRAVTWLTIWLEKAIAARDLAAKGERPFNIAKTLRIWPASNVDGILKVADTLGQRGLRRAVDLLADLDRRSKSGLGDTAQHVDRFIATVAGR